MGVPGLFNFYRSIFPKAVNNFKGIKLFGPPPKLGKFHGLYIDSNGPLHKACQYVFKYEEFKDRSPEEFDSWPLKKKAIVAYKKYFEFILKIRELVDIELLYISLDGPAPICKQNQQRQRRFVAAKASGIKSPDPTRFTSSCITPGTIFMFNLEKYIRQFIIKETHSGKFKDIKVVFNPPSVPGEIGRAHV